MIRHPIALATLWAAGFSCPSLIADTPTLRSVFAHDFLIGVAMSPPMVNGENAEAAGIAARQFSSLTPENAMKWDQIEPRPGRFDFTSSDDYVDFGRRHDMAVIGHTLIWHSQTPDWVFQDKTGAPASRDLLLTRMRDHIRTVVGRYRGRVKGWDVVNEIISDGGPNRLRDSPWERIIGDDYIAQAFRFAHEADPSAELYYNDYGLENKDKRARALAMLRDLLRQGVPIAGVGLQGHYSLTWPGLADIDRTISDFSALGLKVMITELDIDVLPSRGEAGVADIARHEAADPALNPYVHGLPAAVQQQLARRYAALFGLFLRHKAAISRVTFWGLDDGQSWLNDFPVPGRTNYPLLVDRTLKPKPAFFAVMKAGASAAGNP